MVAFSVARNPLWRKLSNRLRMLVALLALTALALSLPAGRVILDQRNKPAEVVALERPLSNFLRRACPGSQIRVLETQPLHILATVDASPERRAELESLLRELCALDAARGDRLIFIPGHAPASPPLLLIFLLGLIPGLLALQQVACWLLPLAVPCLRFSPAVALAGVVCLGWPLWTLIPSLLVLLALLPRSRSTPSDIGLREAAIILASLDSELGQACLARLNKTWAVQLSNAVKRLPALAPAQRKRVQARFATHLERTRRMLGSQKSSGSLDPDLVARTFSDCYLSPDSVWIPDRSPNLSSPIKVGRFSRNIFRCRSCDEIFGDAETLSCHQKVGHCSAEKLSYSCFVCGQLFIDEPGLREHHRAAHGRKARSRRKIFSCPVCDEVFVDEKSLRLHEATAAHQGEQIASPRRKILSCPSCDEVFIDEASLRRHEQSLHAPPPPSKGRPRLAIALILLSALAFVPRPALEHILLPNLPSNRQATETLVEIARLANLDGLMVVEGQQVAVVAAPQADLSQLQVLVESSGLDVSRVRLTRLPEPAPALWGWTLLVLGLGLLLWKPRPRPAQVVATPAPAPAPAPAPTSLEPPKLESLDSLMRVELLEIHLGRRLLALVDDSQGAQLKQRVASIQRHIGLELGFTMPGVRFRDNLALASQDYTILVSDCVVARGTIHVNHFLAIGPLEKLKSLPGEVILDPTYQLPGKWIEPQRRGDAERLGCMLFDPVSVLATQLTEMVRFHAAQLLGVDEVSLRLQESENCLLAGLLAAKGVDLIVVWKVLRLLLKERVSIRDLITILQAIAEHVHLTQEPVLLAEYARVALSAAICRELANDQNLIHVITLDPNLEGLFETGFPDPPTGYKVLEALGEQVLVVQERGLSAVVLTSPAARFRIRQLLERTHPEVRVLSWNEIARGVNVASVAFAQIA